MDGLCPHAGGELHLGDIEEVAGRLSVTCPRHRKKFPGGLSWDVLSGEPLVKAEPLPEAKFNASWRLGVKETAVAEGWLFYKQT